MALTDDYGEPTEIYEGVKKINSDALVLGNELFTLKSEFVYHTGRVNDFCGDKMTDSQIVESATDGMVLGEFSSDQGQKYLFVTARTYDRPYKGHIQFKNSCRIDKMNKDTGMYELVGEDMDSMDIDCIAGEGNLYRTSLKI
jgi:hypothetical protein